MAIDWRAQTVEANGLNFHVVTAGADNAPAVLMLHGFPEYWRAWAPVAALLADDYRLILPDQRGFNFSPKPAEQAAYDTKNLVADMVAVMDQLSPDAPFVLCGHDWGASVAYALAMRHPERVSHLIIANGVHPICFQKALFAGGPQTDASQYMNALRKDGMEVYLAEDGYRRLLNMFEKFSAAPWLTNDTKRAYVEAWSQPGAMPAMLNWYRSSPMIVPESGTAPQDLPITEKMREKYHISMPHLLLWGLQDTALLPEAREDLEEFCDDVELIEIDEASHWILHEQPQSVADAIRSFLTR